MAVYSQIVYIYNLDVFKGFRASKYKNIPD